MNVASLAHRIQGIDNGLTTDTIAHPAHATLSYIERLGLTTMDLVRGTILSLSDQHPSLSVLPGTRTLAEAASRLWHLTDPSLQPREIVRRFIALEREDVIWAIKQHKKVNDDEGQTFRQAILIQQERKEQLSN